MQKRLVVFFFVISFLSISCESIILNPEEIKPPPSVIHESRLATILDSLRYMLDLPALAGGIIFETGVNEVQAAGCRRYGGQTNVTVNDQFHLGSCGKAFTAALMGVLVDEGLVEWNTTLPEIFPEFADKMRSEYKNVTVINLLSHTAGFTRDSDFNPESGTVRDKRYKITERELQKSPAVGRDRILYSNLGFLIAGAVIEKLTNQNYEALMMEKIIMPLGITTAGFGAMGTAGMEDQPLQHTALHVPIIPADDACLNPVCNPAGGLYMSAGDWGKFAKWILRIESGQQTLLKNQTARMIISPVAGGGYFYNGLGWGVTLINGQKYLTHSGSNGYNYSMIELNASTGEGVIAITNQGNADINPPLQKVLERIARYYTTGN